MDWGSCSRSARSGARHSQHPPPYCLTWPHAAQALEEELSMAAGSQRSMRSASFTSADGGSMRSQGSFPRQPPSHPPHGLGKTAQPSTFSVQVHHIFTLQPTSPSLKKSLQLRILHYSTGIGILLMRQNVHQAENDVGLAQPCREGRVSGWLSDSGLGVGPGQCLRGRARPGRHLPRRRARRRQAQALWAPPDGALGGWVHGRSVCADNAGQRGGAGRRRGRSGQRCFRGKNSNLQLTPCLVSTANTNPVFQTVLICCAPFPSAPS